jgi:lipoate-protein ligase A
MSVAAWRLLPDPGAREARSNLALDEALARAGGQRPALRLWRNEPCVVIGRSQLPQAEVDVEACRRLGISVYRRFSGGGAVYHDPGNLNVSLVLGRDDPLLAAPRRDSLHGLYGLVLEPLAAAVRALGCEASAGREVTVGRRKLCGVAAWRGSGAVLVHATLLVDADLDALERVLDGPGAPHDPRWQRTRSLRAPVTSLAREGVPQRQRAAVDEVVAGAFAELERREAQAAGRPARELRAGEPEASELELGLMLLERRYSRPAWHADGVREEVAGPAPVRV